MVLPMLIETSPRFCKIIYKIFGPKQRGSFPSAHMLVDSQGPQTSSQVLSCCSLLPKASVFKCFIVSLLEGSCQWWLQNVLWNMTSSTLKEAVSVAGIHAASYVWHLRSNRTGSREFVGLSGNLHSWFVLAAGGGEWVGLYITVWEAENFQIMNDVWKVVKRNIKHWIIFMDFLQSSIMLTNIASTPYWDTGTQ